MSSLEMMSIPEEKSTSRSKDGYKSGIHNIDFYKEQTFSKKKDDTLKVQGFTNELTDIFDNRKCITSKVGFEDDDDINADIIIEQ